MGCWNATCGLTNLPIPAGAPVRALIIQGNEGLDELNGHCEPTDGAFPVTPALRASYNDYGGIEEIQPSWCDALILKTFGAGAENLESFINEAVACDEAETEDGKPLGLWLAHEDAWTACLSLPGESWEEEPKYAQLLELDRALLLAHLHKEAETDGAPLFIRGLFFDAPGTHRGRNLFRGLLNGELGHSLSPFVQAAIERASTGLSPSDPLADRMFTDLGEIMAVQRAMMLTRRTWLMTSGRGSQSENLEAHTALARTTLAIADSIARRYDET